MRFSIKFYANPGLPFRVVSESDLTRPSYSSSIATRCPALRLKNNASGVPTKQPEPALCSPPTTPTAERAARPVRPVKSVAQELARHMKITARRPVRPGAEVRRLLIARPWQPILRTAMLAETSAPRTSPSARMGNATSVGVGRRSVMELALRFGIRPIAASAGCLALLLKFGER